MALDEYEDGGVAKTFLGPPPPRWFTWLTRACEFVTFILVSVWVFKDLGGLAFTAVSTGTNATDTSGIFNWHPLLMSLAFPVLMAEAVLAYRAPLGPALERWTYLRSAVVSVFPPLTMSVSHSFSVCLSFCILVTCLKPCTCLQATEKAVACDAAHPGTDLHCGGCCCCHLKSYLEAA